MLVKKAASAGITVLGLADHDSTSGWEEATNALHSDMQLVLGSEVSCLTEEGIAVHMLGLLFDGKDEEMQRLLADSRDTRIPRMRKMIENLQAAGYDITFVHPKGNDEFPIGGEGVLIELVQAPPEVIAQLGS
jgi:predicted metal-dependent phosphoesterase TrpH